MNAIKNPHEKIIRIGKGFDVRVQRLILTLQIKEMKQYVVVVEIKIQPFDSNIFINAP